LDRIFNRSLTGQAHHRAMARAIALVATVRTAPHEALRMLVVCGCALALIAAGQALPTL
jgi:hypothetical protein